MLHLKPLIWTQEIRHFPGNDDIGDDEGGYLTTTCVPDAKCDLLLKNGARLRDFEIQLSILRGEIGADRRLKFKRGFNLPAHRNLRVSEGVENLLR